MSAKARRLRGESVFWSVTGPEQLVRIGIAVGGTDSYDVNRALV